MLLLSFFSVIFVFFSDRRRQKTIFSPDKATKAGLSPLAMPDNTIFLFFLVPTHGIEGFILLPFSCLTSDPAFGSMAFLRRAKEGGSMLQGVDCSDENLDLGISFLQLLLTGY
jgi:hypothetical protein